MSHEEKEKKNQLGELFKKVVTTGMGAAFMTEDAIKSLLSDGMLSKEALGNLLQNAKGIKDEVVKQVMSEVKTKLAPINIQQEIDRILENYDIDLKVNVRFQKRDGRPSSSDE